MKVDAVLFDLDGTLADTAPDLALALQAVRDPGLPPLPLADVRKATAVGTEALLYLGLGITPRDDLYEKTRAAFLDHYHRLIGQATVLTPGMASVLKTLAAQGLPWGIVTNKPEALARRVLKALDLEGSSACLVGGDTAARPKPHPDPLLCACQDLGLEPGRCVYIGDDSGDIIAARSAGMPALAAAFGYASAKEAGSWGADGLLLTPGDLLAFIL